MKRLDQAYALKPGSNLWVLSRFEKNFWSKKINWLLNFQITQMLNYKKPSYSSELLEILEKCNLSLTKKTNSVVDPLLIVSQDLLPNKLTLFVESESNELWLRKSLQSIQKLKVKDVRFFIPRDLSLELFEKEIQETDIELGMVTYVECPIIN